MEAIPEQVGTNETLEGIDPQYVSLGKWEVDEAARGLIAFLKEWGLGRSFHIADLVDFYRKHDMSTQYLLFGLICPWYDNGYYPPHLRANVIALIADDDGSLMVTKEFLDKCRG